MSSPARGWLKAKIIFTTNMLPKPTPPAPKSAYLLKTPVHNRLMALTQHSKTNPNAPVKTYVVAFAEKDLAVYARQYAHEGSKIRLRKYRPQNMQRHMVRAIHNQGYAHDKDGILEAIGPLYGDVQAQLVLGKSININKTACTIERMPFEDLILLPLEHHLGIVVAKSIVEESRHHAVFLSEAVEPSNNVELFRLQMADMIR
jgi:hypothetical protein